MLHQNKSEASYVTPSVSIAIRITDYNEFPIVLINEGSSTINSARLGQSLENEAKAHVQLGRLYEGNFQDKSRKNYEMAANLAV